MKVAIAIRGKNLTERLDDRFGRSKYFCIYDFNTDNTFFIENSYTTAQDGVGKHVVDLLTEQDVQMIVACEFGRKVKSILEKKKIQMVIVQNSSLNGNDILEMIRKSK